MVPTSMTIFPVGIASILVTLALGLLCFMVYSYWKPRDIWSKYGVKQAKTSRVFINFRTVFKDLLDEHGDTVGFIGNGPILLTRNLDLLKEIMVKDFNNFVDRTANLQSKSPIATSLFFAKRNEWKRLRRLLSPAFSAGKLKVFGKTVNETAQTLANYLEECATNDILVPLKQTTGQYSSSIIARTAFGLDTECIGKDDNEFTYYSKNMFKTRTNFMRYVVVILMQLNSLRSFLIKTLKIEILDIVNADTNKYFEEVLNQSMNHRKQLELDGKKQPADLLQSLIQAKSVQNEGASSPGLTEQTKPLTQDELVGQALLIIFAGFETTATTLQMALYLLAQHPDVQDKVYEEIMAVVKSDDPTHEELGGLTYTEQVIDEALRLFPPVAVINRQAQETKTYGSITIPAGTDVVIPLMLILTDPHNFPDPEKFDPDRFSEENKAKRSSMAFMPFGQGPRLCIGMRLAYLELKGALVYVLRKVKMELNDRTEPKEGEDVAIDMNQGLLITDKTIKLACKLR